MPNCVTSTPPPQYWARAETLSKGYFYLFIYLFAYLEIYFYLALGPRPEPIDSRPEFLEGTELLDTFVRFGKISFKKEDVRVWDRRWKPSGTTVRHLSRDWMFIPLANVRFVAMANGGVSYNVQPQSICSWASVLCCLKLVWDCLAWIYGCILWILIAVCEWLGKKIDG